MNNQNSKKDNPPTIDFSSIGGKKPPVEKDEWVDSMLEEYQHAQRKQRVDHPTYYNTNNPTLRVKCKCGEVIEVPIECIDVIRDMPTWKGNTIKYLWREGLKEDAALSAKEKEIEDCEKAIWYIQDHVNQLKNKK